MAPRAPGQVRIFTYKTGLLSKVAHDLRLSLDRFSLDAEGDRVVGRFPPDRLRVDGVVRAGALDDRALSAGDKAKIERTIREEILEATRYPEIVFDGKVASDGERHVVEGSLRIRGREQPVVVEGRERDGRVLGSIEITPSRWGIAPYRALLGAIQLQDRVTITFDVPLPEA